MKLIEVFAGTTWWCFNENYYVTCDWKAKTLGEPLLIYGTVKYTHPQLPASPLDVIQYQRSHMASPQANVIINDKRRGGHRPFGRKY